MATPKVQHQCNYCLCKVCNKRRCPRGKYHCMPCYHGTILECKFFLHKKVNRVYRIKRRYNHITEKDLILLRDTLNSILGEFEDEQEKVDPFKSISQLIQEEQQRHRKALKDIARIVDERGKK